MTASNSNTNEKVERLYIGGLNPPKLTVDDVTKRLKSLSEIEILSMDDGSNSQKQMRTFLFLDAKLKLSFKNRETGLSAFDIISSQYHNVRWKGCRLIVEKARLPFLQRLEQERSDKKMNMMIVESKDETTKEGSKIPRQLRIRRKYGEEAIKVDTKPREMENESHWKQCLQNIQKNEKRIQSYLRNKHTFKQNDVSHVTPLDVEKSRTKRSLHLRFKNVDNFIEDTPNTKINETDEVIKYVWSDSNSESDSDSDSESGSESRSKSLDSEQNSINHESNSKPLMKENTYIWSDDDDDDNNNNDDDDNDDNDNADSSESQSQTTKPIRDEIFVDENDINLTKDVTSNLSILSQMFGDINTQPNNVEADQHNDQELEHDKRSTLHTGDGIKTQNDKYDTGISMQRFDPTNKRSMQQYQMQDSIGHDVNSNNDDGDDNNNDICDDESNNDSDNNSNNDYDNDNDNDDDDDNDSESNADNESNDKDQENQNLVEQDINEKRILMGNQSNQNKTIEESFNKDKLMNGTVTDVTANAINNKQYVYEQSKLENIFYEARNNPNTKKSLGYLFQSLDKNHETPTQGDTVDNSTNNNGFSFSFQLDEEPCSPSTVIPKEIESKNSNQKDDDILMNDEEENSNFDNVNKSNISKPSKYGFPIKRHQGFQFYTEFLDSLVKDFYDIHSKEVSTAMNDKIDQEKWFEERKILTTDWKRKQKNALTRKKKKSKYF